MAHAADAAAGLFEREFELSLAKEDFKFSAAHFVAHDGGRERLHGHNYRVAVWLRGRLGADGYVIDFGEAKAAVRAVCRELDELFLLPTRSTTTAWRREGGGGGGGDGGGEGGGCVGGGGGGNIELTVLRDGARFSLPAGDVALLPVANTTVEELSALLAARVVERLGAAALAARRVTSLTVGVTETPGQEARVTVLVPPAPATLPAA